MSPRRTLHAKRLSLATLLAMTATFPTLWRAMGDATTGESTSRSQAPTRTVFHASTHRITERVLVRVNVQCDATARVSGDFYRYAPGTELRFGAYTVLLVGTGSGPDQVLYREMGMLHCLPHSRTPVVSVTRLTTEDLSSYSAECGVRNEAELIVSLEPAAGLNWEDVEKRDQVIVAARLNPLR